MAWLLLASAALAASGPGDLYREATTAFESGDRAIAEAKLTVFRQRYPSHQLYWQASLMWARCARTPAEAAQRFSRLAQQAPPETKAECELEQAHLLMLQEKFSAAAAAYAVWLKARPRDERADVAGFWRGVCLNESGRGGEAQKILAVVCSAGQQSRWRAQAGLLLASIKAGQEGVEAAHREYGKLVDAAWAADVRPQALLGAAQTATNTWKRKTLLKTLDREYPKSAEAAKARAMLKERVPAGIRFGVQTGAFAERAHARAQQQKLTKEGYRVSIVKRKRADVVLHAVLVGPFATRAQASLEAGALKARGHPAVFVTLF